MPTADNYGFHLKWGKRTLQKLRAYANQTSYALLIQVLPQLATHIDNTESQKPPPIRYSAFLEIINICQK